MDVLSQIIDYISRTNLFNFAIFAGIIVYIAVKLNVNNMLETSVKSVVSLIKSSEQKKSDSEENLNKVKKDMEQIDSYVEKIYTDSQRNSNMVGEKIMSDAHNESETIKNNTIRTINNKQMFVKSDLIKRVSEASIETAREHIISELSSNKELHEKLIYESIDALEGIQV